MNKFSIKFIQTAGLAAMLGLAAGCGAPSNESTADISGQQATTGAKGAVAPPKTQQDYATQYGSTGKSAYGGQGYPGAN